MAQRTTAGTHKEPALPASPTATLSAEERAELRRQGAKAAARGEPATANPMDRQLNSPEATGETAALWAERSRAWQDGHRSETSRGAGPRAPGHRQPHGR